MRTTRCKSCDAQVAWVRTANGKAMLIDAAPTEAGNVLVVDGSATVFADSTALSGFCAEAPRYLSHFATCPDSKDWRKR